MKISPNEIAALAKNAGFTGEDQVVAVAVAIAESGGETDAYNPETAAGTPEGRGSYGLWQVYRVAHPKFDSWDLKDPVQNATAAFDVYKSAGKSFRPWSTYIYGLYSRYMDTAREAVANPAALQSSGSFLQFAVLAAGVYAGYRGVRYYLEKR